MKFSVPTNWQKDLIPKLRKDCVYELYGKLNADFVGGGRASSVIPLTSKKQVRTHISEAHKNNIKFNYLLNATCLNNLEWTISGQRRLQQLMNWLMDLGVDSVTVAIPYLLELIKKQYPQLKVYVSTQAGVDTIERAKYWEDLRADEITLSFLDINRNFHLLREIRKNIKCKLKLIANLDCLYNCPFYQYHSVLNSHASQSNHPTRGFMIDYCYLSCSRRRLMNPVEFIRSPWIRPEDIHHYEDLGIDKIKLVNRGMTTEKICLVVNAYTNRYYEGNLLDLFSDPSKNIMQIESSLFHKFKYFFRPFSVNLLRFYKGKELFLSREVYIDNRALNDFLEHFLKEDCYLKSCEDCGYCKRVAERVVKISPEYRQCIFKKHSEFLDMLISGRMFNYKSR